MLLDMDLLLYKSNTSLKTQTFSDSDWTTCATTRRFVSGYCVFLGTSLVAWNTKNQTTISRSFSDAEYRALASLACEIQWIQYLLRDLHFSVPTPYTVFCDNNFAIHIVKNLTLHERTKHIELDCHIIRQKLVNDLIHFFHIPSTSQLADMFTKSLYPFVFRVATSKLGRYNFMPTLRGGDKDIIYLPLLFRLIEILYV